ncbi:MAG: ArgE/DapE family deacylase [Candidatus Bathyarchaeota archaeon]|nr:ArgE/DapE family deacylase [Candidatus Bathyarchaeota archaeon]
MAPADPKKRLQRSIDEEKDELVGLLSSLVRISSDNPPGSTVEVAHFVKEYLEARGFEPRLYEPNKGNVNVVASWGESSPHLILNGHLDQFPAEVGEAWSVPPYSGDVKDGCVWGRGSGDMKGGLASLIHGFCATSKLGLPGKVTITCTSDEETGGRWGALWLLDNVPGLIGDGVLSGEPSGGTVRIGEKGMIAFTVKTRGKPAHGSFAGYAGENAIMKMGRLLPEIEALRNIPASLTTEEKTLTEELVKGYTVQFGHEAEGLAGVLRHVTVNVGVIRGGAKANIVPAECEAEVDMRVPIGVSPGQLKATLTEKLRSIDPSASVEFSRHPSTILGATYSPPDSKMAKVISENAKLVTGSEPFLSFTSGGTDCRFWRQRGVPAVAYGPKVYAMGAADERVPVEDLLTTAKVHVGTIIDFLSTT